MTIGDVDFDRRRKNYYNWCFKNRAMRLHPCQSGAASAFRGGLFVCLFVLFLFLVCFVLFSVLVSCFVFPGVFPSSQSTGADLVFPWRQHINLMPLSREL